MTVVAVLRIERAHRSVRYCACLEQREHLAETAGQQERLTATLDNILEAVEDRQAFEQGFDATFGALPAESAPSWPSSHGRQRRP